MSRTSGNSRIPKKKIVLSIIAIYLACTLLGCFIIWGITCTKKKTDLLEICQAKGEEILSAGQIEPVMIFGMDYTLVSESDFELYRINNFLYESEWEKIPGYARQVFEKGQIFIPTVLLLDNRNEAPSPIFGVVIGTLVESRQGYSFASILIRDFSDLDVNMFIYVCLFTFLYAIGLIFFFRTLQKERELNRMRRDLIANVSHELKTPITSIRASAEVLHDGLLKDERSRREYSGKILEESDRLEELVLNILELSRLQSKREEFHKVSAYADGIVPPVVDRYMMLCGDLGIALDTTGLDLEHVPELYTDMEKFPTLMSIFLDNAVKFTGQGGRIWISDQIGSKAVTFCIRDNGPGIRSEDMHRIFDRFYKADTAHNSSGSGLGLAIAQEIINGLGEKMWVESTYGQGSAFYFTVSYR